jgi:hypothetical protein
MQSHMVIILPQNNAYALPYKGPIKKYKNNI